MRKKTSLLKAIANIQKVIDYWKDNKKELRADFPRMEAMDMAKTYDGDIKDAEELISMLKSNKAKISVLKFLSSLDTLPREQLWDAIAAWYKDESRRRGLTPNQWKELHRLLTKLIVVRPQWTSALTVRKLIASEIRLHKLDRL